MVGRRRRDRRRRFGRGSYRPPTTEIPAVGGGVRRDSTLLPWNLEREMRRGGGKCIIYIYISVSGYVSPRSVADDGTTERWIIATHYN